MEFVRYPVDTIREQIAAIFAAVGATEDEVPILTDQVVHAAMRTHPGQGQGLEKIPRIAERMQAGTVHPGAKIEIIKEGPAWVHIDGHQGWGVVVAAQAMDLAIAKAKKYGIGLAIVKHSNHLGTCQYHALRAVKEGLIGFCFTNAGPEMAPWGGITPVLGTNPWGIGVPWPEKFPIVLDMALTQSGKGMVRWYMQEGKKIPTNWAYAPDGSETDDPELAMQGPLVPVGEFKGTGLSMITDILCGVMSGAAFGLTPYSDPANHDVGHMLMALDPACFISPEDFSARLAQFVDEIKSSKLKPGFTEILLPGEMEHRRETDALANGLPVAKQTVTGIQELCAKLNIPCLLS